MMLHSGIDTKAQLIVWNRLFYLLPWLGWRIGHLKRYFRQSWMRLRIIWSDSELRLPPAKRRFVFGYALGDDK